MGVVGCCVTFLALILLRGRVDRLSAPAQRLYNEIHVWKVKYCQIFTTESSSVKNLQVYILLPDMHHFTSAAEGGLNCGQVIPTNGWNARWSGSGPDAFQNLCSPTLNCGEAGLRSARQPTGSALMSRRTIRRLDGGRSAELWPP